MTTHMVTVNGTDFANYDSDRDAQRVKMILDCLGYLGNGRLLGRIEVHAVAGPT